MFWNKTNFITRSLPYYDGLVNKINCHYVWKCNEKHIFEHYLKNIGRNHLDWNWLFFTKKVSNKSSNTNGY